MASFAGKQWFRDNIEPYLTVLKAEIASGGGGGGYAPIVDSYSPIVFSEGITVTVTVLGQFITPDITATSATATISNITFISTHEFTFDITSPTAQMNTVVIANPAGNTSITIESTPAVAATWVDLRVGSTDTWVETHNTGATITYDANGLASTGTLWGSWYKFTSHSWARTVKKRVSIIMLNNNVAHMVGIMGNEQVETSTTQYQEAEIYAYIPSNYFYGFYGTNANHTLATQLASGGGTFTGFTHYKVVYENNGEPGSTFSVYGLNGLTNFDDTTNLIEQVTVSNSMNADSVTLSVAATTSSSCRMVAFKIEDM